MSQGDSIRGHFTLFGFPVRVHPLFWVISLLFGASGLGSTWTSEALLAVGLWVLVVFVSILWHELGHAFAMRRFGYAPFILLHGMGGATAWGAGPARPSPKVRVIVSLAGPFFGFALGGVVFAASLLIAEDAHWAVRQFVRAMIWVNVGWGACNLVPMLPWDGGQALHGALDHFTGGKGLRPTAVITIATAAIIAGLVLWLLPGDFWPLLLCALSVAIAVRALRAPAPAAEGAAVDAPATAAPDDPREALAQARRMLERAGDAKQLTQAILWRGAAAEWGEVGQRLAEAVAPQAGSPTQRALALELAAWCHLLGGDPRAADEAARRMRPTHDPSPILAALIAAANGRAEEALAAARDADDEAEADARRLLEAWALATLGRFEEAVDAASERAPAAFVDAALFHAGAFDAAAALGAALFARFGDAEDAYNTACSHARAGRIEEGLDWLARAVDAGYDDLAHLEQDDDLAPVRALEAYGALRARLEP
ncbi:MAG: hypothetical protein KF729_24125 [Sandaracinaceae bacterium]|nr:hypothetical protein [Sandaracinaceae bacterium]